MANLYMDNPGGADAITPSVSAAGNHANTATSNLTFSAAAELTNIATAKLAGMDANTLISNNTIGASQMLEMGKFIFTPSLEIAIDISPSPTTLEIPANVTLNNVGITVSKGLTCDVIGGVSEIAFINLEEGSTIHIHGSHTNATITGPASSAVHTHDTQILGAVEGPTVIDHPGE